VLGPQRVAPAGVELPAQEGAGVPDAGPAAAAPAGRESPVKAPGGAAHGGRTIQGSIWKRYGFAWVTAGFFLVSLAGHWVFGWFAYVDERLGRGQPVEAPGYLVQMMRDTLENWQSEFLQLLWQVVGLALLLCVGSPQSKEGDDRVEAKLDALLRRVASPPARPTA
jgi:hypothetical protein